MVYVEDVNILGGRAHTINKHAEVLVVGSKETRLEGNDDNTKYTEMSRDQNAGRRHGVKIDNSSFERVEEFKCLGKTLTKKILFRKK